MALPRIASIRAVLQWPARFLASTGLTSVKDGDTTTISLAVNDLTLEASPDLSNDYIPFWDASAGAHRKMTVNSAAAGGYTGLEFNTRLAKTAAYTLVNADKGKTVALGGSNYYVLTVGAASGFDSDFIVRIVNEDADRGKRITANGVTSFILWPKQTMHLYNQNNVWQADRPAYFNGNGFVLNVDSSVGADTNDGLATGATNALLTIQKAVDVIQDEWLGGGTIQLADGTYTSGASIVGSIHGATTIGITGNSGTPANVVVSVGGSQACFSCQDHAGLSLDGVTLESSGSGSTGLHARQFAIVDFLNINFGAFSNGFHISVSDEAIASSTGNYAITGDAAVHVGADNGSTVHLNATVTIGSARAFTTFASASGNAQIDGTTVFSGGGVAGTTGTKFTGINGGTVDASNTYPGDVAGFIWAGDARYGGTAASPYYNFSSLDDDSGFYRISADRVGLALSGALQVDFTQTGILQPLMPVFSAINNADATNVTGDGTVYTVAFGTELFDRGADFASNTFTAPVTGLYRLEGCISISNVGGAHTTAIVNVVTTARSYQAAFVGPLGTMACTAISLPFSVIADMSAGHTATVTVSVAASTKTVTVDGHATNPPTYFTGSLVG